VVPTVAIQRGPQGTYVYAVGQDKTAQMKPVTIALTTGEVAVIDKGLEGGEQVIRRRPANQVRPGGQVAPTSPNGRPERRPGSGAGSGFARPWARQAAAHRPARRGRGSSPDAARSSRGSAGGRWRTACPRRTARGSRGSQAKFALPPDSIDRAVRRRGRPRRPRLPPPREYLRDRSFGGRSRRRCSCSACSWRASTGYRARRSPRCRRSITRRSWWRPSCRGRPPTRWPPRSPRRSSASSAGAVARADDVGVELRELADHAPVHARSRPSTPPARRPGRDQRGVELVAADAAGAADYSKSNPADQPILTLSVASARPLAARRGR